jgi:3-phenylpropionate/cinnamic acid dioxygenase small subunit
MNAPQTMHLRDAGPDEARSVDLALHHEVEQFYFREARLHNQRLARQWLEQMVDPEIHYWLPILEDRYVKDARPAPTPDDPAIYNDDYAALGHRIERLETGLVWMEDPPARVRYFVANVEAFHTDAPDVLGVYCNVHIYRNRRQRDETHHFYGREDLLRRGTDGGLRLYRRKIVLDQRVVLDKNLYLFL